MALSDEELREATEILRRIVSNANEAMQYGPYDQIDNAGEYYQSEAFYNALNSARSFLARAALQKGNGNGSTAD